MKPSYELFLQKSIEQATNQAITMAVQTVTSPVSGLQSPFGKKPVLKINSRAEMNSRFKHL